MQGGVAELSAKPKRYVPLCDPRRLARDTDMRSSDGQRFASIFDMLALEFAEADPARIRDIAVLRFAAERALDVGNFEDVVRLHNTIERKEARLRVMLKAKRLERGSQPLEGLRARLQAKSPGGGPMRTGGFDGIPEASGAFLWPFLRHDLDLIAGASVR
jgi:hypothetical protein